MDMGPAHQPRSPLAFLSGGWATFPTRGTVPHSVLTVSSLHSIIGKGDFCVSFTRTLIPNMRVPLLWLNDLPKTHLPVPSHWGLGGHKHLSIDTNPWVSNNDHNPNSDPFYRWEHQGFPSLSPRLRPNYSDHLVLPEDDCSKWPKATVSAESSLSAWKESSGRVLTRHTY